MAKFARICIATNFLLGIVQAAVLYQHPVDVTVRLNDLARFNCTVNCICADNVGWYKAGYEAVLKSTTELDITVMEPSPGPCTSGRQTYFFSVVATEALNNSAIYCAAYTDPEVPGCQSVCISEMCYSRPALLTVVKAAAADTIILSTTSRMPEITPSSSSFPTQGYTIEATSPADVPLTTTVTSSPTNCPTIATTTSNSSSTAEVSGVAAASARITCAKVMVLLAGLVIGSILL